MFLELWCILPLKNLTSSIEGSILDKISVFIPIMPWPGSFLIQNPKSSFVWDLEVTKSQVLLNPRFQDNGTLASGFLSWPFLKPNVTRDLSIPVLRFPTSTVAKTSDIVPRVSHLFVNHLATATCPFLTLKGNFLSKFSFHREILKTYCMCKIYVFCSFSLSSSSSSIILHLHRSK